MTTRFPARSTTHRGGKHDRRHQQARTRAATRHHDTDPCARCGNPLGPMGPWLHYDHDDTDPTGTSYLGFAHAHCNIRAGAQLGNRRSRGIDGQRRRTRAW